MRKITKEACRAFHENRPYKKDNTEVTVIQDFNGNIVGANMYLFGNRIATKENNHILINFQGYNTVTTRERLNGLSNVSFTSKRNKLYMDGVEISSYQWHVI